MNQLLEEVRAAIWSVWNRRWLALGMAWAICLLGWLAVALFPNSYESQSRIFVQLDDILAEQIGMGSGSRQRDLDRVRQTLVSAVNLEKVVRSTRLGDEITNAAQMEGAIAQLADDISVVSEGENLFEISAVSGRSDFSAAENAQLAQIIVQRMIDIFREENMGGARGDMRETLDFLNAQLLAGMFDEPFADGSALPTWRVCQLARESVTVALSGDGADEAMAGYRRQVFHHHEERFRRMVPERLRAGVLAPLG